MKKLWMGGAIVLTVAALFVLVPKVSAGAAASDFKVEGNTLVSYTGTATTVSVPSNIEVIGRSAFEDNDEIKKVTIPDSVTTIEEYAFWGCDNLETVVLGKGLKEVADFTFTSCTGLSNITIPDNIRRIGIMSFADCAELESLYIPISVTDIHETAFDGVPNLQIKAEKYSYVYQYAIDRGEALANAPVSPAPTNVPAETQQSQPTPAPAPTPEPTNRPIGEVMGSATVVGNSAVVFINNRDMKVADGADVDEDAYIEPGSKQTKIADWIYYGDKTLIQIELQEGIKQIGDFAFARSNLERIELPEGLTTIEYAAFYHCDNLEDINIPSTVTKIEAKAFTFTPWLEAFLSGETGESDFLIVGDGLLLAYRGDTAHVVIPEGVKYIAAEAFLQHKEIEEVQFPTTLEAIADTAFEGCTYEPAN